MKKRADISITFIILLLLGSIVWGQSSKKSIATFHEHAAKGTSLIHKEGAAVDIRQNRAPAGSHILWSRYLSGPIYHSTANAPDGHVIAGTYLMSPRQAEFFTKNGGGIPEWVYGGSKFLVDAADRDFIMAGIDDQGDNVKVIKWTGPGNGTPDWTFDLPERYFSYYHPANVVSRDGTTIAAIIMKSGHPELVMFDSSTAAPIVDEEFTDLGVPRRIQISSKGRFAAFRCPYAVVIYDRDLNTVREQINIPYGSNPLDISGNGDLIAYGFYSLILQEWTGLSYRELWEFNDSYHLGTVAISADGSTIAAGWYSRDYRQAKVTVHSRSSAVPLWTYEYLHSEGHYQVITSCSDISSNGRFFIVGNWGDSENIKPEVHVFDKVAGPAPISTVDMPGSVLSVNMSPDGHYASACGKHVHANQSGNSGDLVALELPHISVFPQTSGETYAAGKPMPIEWLSSGVTGDVKILLVRSDKSDRYIITRSVPYDSSPYDYIIPRDVTVGTYFIRVSQGILAGRSDNFFIGKIVLHSPNGGEDWPLGSTRNISWTVTGITDNLHIILRRYGKNVALIAKNIDPAIGSYSWTVGDCLKGEVRAASDYRLLIVSKKSANVRDVSNNTFRISSY